MPTLRRRINTAIIRSFVLIVIPTALIIMASMSVQKLSGSSNASAITITDTGKLSGHIISYLGAAASAVDQTITMLSTIQLSAFILVGFAVKKIWSTDIPKFVVFGSGFVFVGSAFLSLSLGYAARMQILEIMNEPHFGLKAIEVTISRQALFVVLSSAAALSLFMMAFYERITSRFEYEEDASAGRLVLNNEVDASLPLNGR